MCSVSARPVMKMTGTWATACFALRRRQVSNPSMPGITASRRMMSGVTSSTRARARSPATATSTVAPERSIASVRKLRVSDESSTTRTMSCCASDIAGEPLEHAEVTAQIVARDQPAHLGHEGGGGRGLVLKLRELGLDAPHMPDSAEAQQLADLLAVGDRRCRGGTARDNV